MPKFFVPTSWENLAEAMKFRSKVSLGDNSAEAKTVHAISSTRKKKKVKKPKLDTDTAKDLANAKVNKSGLEFEKVHKGRIDKKNVDKNPRSHAKVVSTSGYRGPQPVDALSSTKLNLKGTKKRNKSVPIAASISKEAVKLAGSANTSLEKDNSDSELVRPTSSQDIGLKTFENTLKQQLLGGRFRYINEQLYTMDSTDANEFFKSDAEAFNAYHAGYQQQVEKWPMNPLDRIIKMIKRLPKSLEIVDFGCGEGRLATMLPNKVYSMDLVSTRSDIIACDMACTPLNDQSVDIAVYCLSLMGTNLKDYLLEANRVLRPNGLVIIAEIQSRFDDLRQFIRGLEACGFELLKKDINERLFYFFQFKKVRNVGKVVLIPPFSLKPCLYRKR
ncbi:ribosomal RNA-processing protein 8 [Bactrocera neohumeralis]|uniref:ribosomal RNA-processing protein 8 n=1 Tax=Bactrocera tryoni TaxID=59916 RepID=UPI001A976FC5|nr:ribosomal RNA-processing protein 8 [Bactrocera tryoni]XP_050325982.1 ribosomal RNA-processing protein 8 [Bactrocera neohumeralis]